ncbi:MAG: hypothetical protein EBU84_00425 [Actinobacteria bacterium]|jgi:hypothetical protein|nr:hypothetical protein [Actinomycetota bacterium]
MNTSLFTKSFVSNLYESTPLEKRAGIGSWMKTLAVLGVPLAIGSYAFGKGLTSGQSDRAKKEAEEYKQSQLRQSYFGT